jgi:hypothetical protein
MSLLAIAIATGGSAYAAVYTGASIKDFSLTSAKVKNGSIQLRDISSKGIATLKGNKGVQGPKGPKGDRGPAGLQGDKGTTGADAHATTGWAYRESAALNNWVEEFPIPEFPNDNAADWDSATYGYGGNQIPALAAVSNFSSYPNFQGVSHLFLGMDGVKRPVVALSGMPAAADLEEQNSSGTVTTSYTGNLSATAQLTFMHRNDGETGNQGNGVSQHGRLECDMVYGNGDLTNSSNAMGVPVYVSSMRDHEIVNFTIVGNATSVQQGNYNVAVRCVDADLTSSAQWQFISANLSAMAAEQ